MSSGALAALVLAARLALAAVFAVAGAAKLADRRGTREAVVAFGAPERLGAPVALLLPLAELAVAALLVPAPTAVAGAVGALALLLLFAAAIAVNLARGRTPDCHCFGKLHSAPTSWKTLARAVLLAAVAVFVLAGSLAEPGRSAVGWIGGLEGPELLALVAGGAALVVVALGAVAVYSLLRSYGELLLRLERLEERLTHAGIAVVDEAVPELGLEPGTPAPFFAADEVTGGRISLDGLLSAGRPLLLFFTSPGCASCKALLPRAAGWQREHADRLTIAFASDGAAGDLRAEAEEFELGHVFVDEGQRLYNAYRATATPSAVVIAPDGTIGSWVAAGSDWIETLIGRALGGAAELAGLPIGAEAPRVELPGLEGQTVSLADFRGRDTILLFWNPSCGFCREMHEELLEWESSRADSAPQLLVVSFGGAEETRAEGFRSPVALDRGFAAGDVFGASGTPTAVLLDADGRVASRVAAGVDDVLGLVDGHP